MTAVDPGATELYFETLFAQQPANSLIAISRKNQGWNADFYDTPQEAAAACVGGLDVYARATPLRELPPLRKNGTRGRGNADLSVALLALVADLDLRGVPDGHGGVREHGFDSREQALAVAHDVLPVSMLVDSGGGLQPYVLLAEPLVITTAEDFERAAALEERYVAALRRAAGGVKLDAVHDLSHVFRVVGTWNGKGAEPRPVTMVANGEVIKRLELGHVEAELPPLETSGATKRKKGTREKRKVTVDQELVSRMLKEHPGLETLSARTGSDPSADDYALACAAGREGLEADVIEQLLVHRLLRHGDPKGKATERDDYVPLTVERALAAVARERRDEELGDPLGDASSIIGMQDEPIILAEERRSGVVILERADGLVLRAPSLEGIAKYDRLRSALGAAFGHDLDVEKGEGARTAVRFVSALRRHFGPASAVRAAEERVEVWMIELVRAADEVEFTAGDEKASAWEDIDAASPDAASSAPKFAKEVVLAREETTNDRYLRASWAHEYLRRCGFRGSGEEVAALLEALGLEQPNADGRVRGGTLQFRFWVIPKELFERWSS